MDLAGAFSLALMEIKSPNLLGPATKLRPNDLALFLHYESLFIVIVIVYSIRFIVDKLISNRI